jgi:hypothetical protein
MTNRTTNRTTRRVRPGAARSGEANDLRPAGGAADGPGGFATAGGGAAVGWRSAVRRRRGPIGAILPGLALPALAAPARDARAWPTAMCARGPFSVHGDIAAHALDHPTIAPYLAPLGLSREACIAAAAIEPQCAWDDHPSWRHFLDGSFLDWEPNDVTVGIILHVAADSGVAACHSPANEIFCSDAAETRFEADGELAGVPPLTATLDGTLDEKLAAFHAAQSDLTRRFRAFWESNPLCPLCSTRDHAVDGMNNGQRLAQAVLLAYLQDLLPDGPPEDAGTDAGDADADAVGDVAEDAGPDGPDGGADAGEDDLDAPADAGTDGTPDAGPDAGSTPDAADDVPADAGATDGAGEASDGPPSATGGCGCGVPRAPDSLAAVVLSAMMIGLAARRRLG